MTTPNGTFSQEMCDLKAKACRDSLSQEIKNGFALVHLRLDGIESKQNEGKEDRKQIWEKLSAMGEDVGRLFGRTNGFAHKRAEDPPDAPPHKESRKEDTPTGWLATYKWQVSIIVLLSALAGQKVLDYVDKIIGVK